MLKIIFLGVLIIFLAFISISIMLVSLFKQGDERREIIMSKVCRNSLLTMLGYLIISAIEQSINSSKGLEIKGINPFWQLIILAIIYIIQISYYKRRYGG